MRGKCETCEFYKKIFSPRQTGTCHIRSVASDDWPLRNGTDGCGEHMPKSIQADPPEDLPEVHTVDRVEKSMERVEEPS